MKQTRYFAEQVLGKRPTIDPADCERALASALRHEIQDDGRIRHWGRATDARDGKPRILRVVTLADGETVHNACYDRDFREDET